MRHNDGGIESIQEGEVTQEEVHGGVEVGISSDHQQYQQVSYESQEVNPQEQCKEQGLDLRVVGES